MRVFTGESYSVPWDYTTVPRRFLRGRDTGARSGKADQWERSRAVTNGMALTNLARLLAHAADLGPSPVPLEFGLSSEGASIQRGYIFLVVLIPQTQYSTRPWQYDRLGIPPSTTEDQWGPHGQ